MKADNPAVYECPVSKDKLHTWRRYETTGRAMCTKCLRVITRAQANEVWEDHDALPSK